VTSDIPGCRDVVIDGVSGFLVERGNINDLVRALTTLLESAALRQRMGRSGRARALAEFSLEKVVEATLTLYATLLSKSDYPLHSSALQSCG
jgi:glycosyltransferase involved in cell wall biosynthesis